MDEKYDKTFIAIDYGSRRIGIARSDPGGMIASALVTLTVSSVKQALAELSVILAENEPNGLVIGYPLLADGSISDKCLEIDRFIEKLKAIYSGPIHRVDEQYSSVEAVSIIRAHGKKSGKRKGVIDRLAAVIILQRFLDEQ